MYIHRALKITAQLWGNSLGLRIPALIAREAKLGRGSVVDLQFEDGRIVLTPLRKTRQYKLGTLLAKASRKNLPVDDPWGAPMGRELG
jgi:antitoxin MazE